MTDTPLSGAGQSSSPAASAPEAPAVPTTPQDGGGSPNQELRERVGALALGATGLAPRSINELMDFAQLMARGGPMIGKAFRDEPGACLAIIMQAMRWGMDPFAVSQKAYVANENIAYEAQLVTAVINAHAPIAERLKPTFNGEGAARTCTISARLKGEHAPAEYTSPEMGKIPTKNSPLWKSDPDQQLFYYSSRMWARRYCPEVILGVYAVEEMETVEGDYERDPDANGGGFHFPDEEPNLRKEHDARPFLGGRGMAAEREQRISELKAKMEAATSHQALDEALGWFTSRWRVSQNAWVGIQEMYALEGERVDDLNARDGADDMDAAFADTVGEG